MPRTIRRRPCGIAPMLWNTARVVHHVVEDHRCFGAHHLHPAGDRLLFRYRLGDRGR